MCVCSAHPGRNVGERGEEEKSSLGFITLHFFQSTIFNFLILFCKRKDNTNGFLYFSTDSITQNLKVFTFKILTKKNLIFHVMSFQSKEMCKTKQSLTNFSKN